MRVRANTKYRYNPVPMDRINPPFGVSDGYINLRPGDTVTVVNLPGCPKANTMGHCHINKDDKFAGLVCTGSLERR